MRFSSEWMIQTINRGTTHYFTPLAGAQNVTVAEILIASAFAYDGHLTVPFCLGRVVAQFSCLSIYLVSVNWSCQLIPSPEVQQPFLTNWFKKVQLKSIRLWLKRRHIVNEMSEQNKYSNEDLARKFSLEVLIVLESWLSYQLNDENVELELSSQELLPTVASDCDNISINSEWFLKNY